MEPLIAQIERVRGRALRMLAAMRAASAATVVLTAAMVLGVSDYGLRLPGWLRLLILLAAGAWGVWTLTVHTARWRRVRMSLPLLAMRLERVYPWTAGKLASAVSFVTRREGQEGPIGDELARDTVAEARGLLTGVEVAGVLETAPLMRRLAVLSVAAVAALTFVIASPASVGIAMARWIAPFGDAAWPNRHDVESATRLTVAANDAPLAVSADVLRGDSASLRVWAVYRFAGEEDASAADRGLNTDWQRVLMTRQPGSLEVGRYQRLIEPDREAGHVELYFEAGDDRTQVQSIDLISPPRLARLTARVDPPAYAAGFEPMTRHDLLNPPRGSVTVEGRAGSRVALSVRVSGSYKPYEPGGAALNDWLAATVPGLTAGLSGEEAATLGVTYRAVNEDGGEGFEIAFTLRRAVRLGFRLEDEYAERHADQRVFAFEPREDRSPDVSIVTPASDVLVLAGAVVDLAAEARDDVAVSHLSIQGWKEGATERVTLAESTEPGPSVSVGYTLDLSGWDLKSGDAVLAAAVARDNFVLDGVTHDAVESSWRRIGIISEDELVRQVRTELAEVRQRAERARVEQNRLFEEGAATDPTAEAGRRELGEVSRRQRDTADRAAGLERTLDEIGERVARNRLEDGWIERTLAGSRLLAEQAAEAAREAADRLARSAAENAATDDAERREQREAGGAQQQRASQRLSELIDLLDQGRDAFELRQRLSELERAQEELAGRTQATMPRTLGRERDELSEQERTGLEQMAEGQSALSREAARLAQRMRAAASALSRQSERPEDQATAEALRRAAETAAREQLDEQMRQASEQIDRNRLAQAGQAQERARQAIRSMLEQMGRIDEFREEILKRKLAELADAIARLRDQQQAQLDRLIVAELLGGLDGPLLALRQNTLAVAEQARTTGPETQEIGKLLEKAAGHQAAAVRELRSPQLSKPNVEQHERDALAALEEALAEAEKLARSAEDEQRQREREELIAAYRAVRAKQAELADGTAALAAAAEAERDRRWRAETRRASESQAQVRTELEGLRAKVGDSIVFQSAHDQLDAWAGGAAERLGRSVADGRVMLNQRMIVSTLDDLVAALQPVNPDERFATGDNGGQGGQGGAGGQDQLIPPAAEVKMLRSRQVRLHDVTRLLDEQPETFGGERDEVLVDVAKQQLELADTGTRLIQTLQQQQGGAALPGPMRREGEGGRGRGADEGAGGDDQPRFGPVGRGGVAPLFGQGVTEEEESEAEATPSTERPAPAEQPSLDELLDLPTRPDATPPVDPSAETPAPTGEESGESGRGPADLFMSAVNDMKFAGERLNGAADAGIDTQRVQERAIRRLDQLIDQLQNQQNQQGRGGGQPRQQDTGSEQNQQRGNQQNPGGGPADQAADRAGDRGRVRDGEREDRPLSERLAEWGNLPQRMRDQLLQGAEDRVSPIYRSLTERYYKRLAEQAP